MSSHGEQGMGSLLNLCRLQLGVNKVQGGFWWLDIASWSVQRSWLDISRLKASWGYDIHISWSWSWDKRVVAGEQLDWVCPKGPAAMLALRKWVGMDLSHSKEASLANTHAVKCHCWRWWNCFSPWPEQPCQNTVQRKPSRSCLNLSRVKCFSERQLLWKSCR